MKTQSTSLTSQSVMRPHLKVRTSLQAGGPDVMRTTPDQPRAAVLEAGKSGVCNPIEDASCDGCKKGWDKFWCDYFRRFLGPFGS
jgi:hypothetical protein